MDGNGSMCGNWYSTAAHDCRDRHRAVPLSPGTGCLVAIVARSLSATEATVASWSSKTTRKPQVSSRGADDFPGYVDLPPRARSPEPGRARGHAVITIDR